VVPTSQITDPFAAAPGARPNAREHFISERHPQPQPGARARDPGAAFGPRLPAGARSDY